MRWFQRNWLAIVLLAAFGGLMAWQLFPPGFIGIADTGDFGRVAGWLCLAPKGHPTTFSYFQPEWVWSARNFWDSPYRSSETALGWIAIHLAGATREGALFDIRWLSAVHLLLCLAGFAAFLAALSHRPKAAQILIAGVPVLLLTDVCYTAMLNSFYMDAVAFCALILMAGIAIWISVEESPRPFPLAAFSLGAILFVTSKTQHAIWAFLPALFLTVCCLRTKIQRIRVAGFAAAAFIFLSGVYMEQTADLGYKGQALFNVLFFRIGSQGAAAMPDLIALGVKPEEARYLGMHSYSAGSPMDDREFAEDFYRRTGFIKLLGWYWRHPAKTFDFVLDRLLWEKEIMRPNNLSNYPVDAGREPGARTYRFGWWSDMRSALFHEAPWYFPLWYAVFVAGCGSVIRRRRSPVSTRLAWLALGIAGLGSGEFVASGLADCLDMARHLFLFHACTDLTVCFAVAQAVHWVGLGKISLPARHSDFRVALSGR